MKRIHYFLIVLILGILVFVWYAGAFENINIVEQTDGPYMLIGLDHKGPYKDIGTKFEKVKNELKSIDIETDRALGIYYDNPSDVSETELRSFGASIIEGDNLNKLNQIKSTSLQLDSISKAPALIVDLPARSMFCYMIYPMKVYPAFEKIINEKSYKGTFAYEVYDMKNKKVRYVMQIEE